MVKGYMGKILRVDLTNKTLKDESVSEELYRKYIGGVGLSAYYLGKECDENTDPLGEDNRFPRAIYHVTLRDNLCVGVLHSTSHI